MRQEINLGKSFFTVLEKSNELENIEMNGVLAWLLLTFIKERARKKIAITTPNYTASIEHGSIIFRQKLSQVKRQCEPSIGSITDFIDDILEYNGEDIQFVKDNPEYGSIAIFQKLMMKIRNLNSLNNQRTSFSDCSYEKTLTTIKKGDTEYKVIGSLKSSGELNRESSEITTDTEYFLSVLLPGDKKPLYRLPLDDFHSNEAITTTALDFVFAGQPVRVDLTAEKIEIEKRILRRSFEIEAEVKTNYLKELLLVGVTEAQEITDLLGKDLTSEESRAKFESIMQDLYMEMDGILNKLRSYDSYLAMITPKEYED